MELPGRASPSASAIAGDATFASTCTGRGAAAPRFDVRRAAPSPTSTVSCGKSPTRWRSGRSRQGRDLIFAIFQRAAEHCTRASVDQARELVDDASRIRDAKAPPNAVDAIGCRAREELLRPRL